LRGDECKGCARAQPRKQESEGSDRRESQSACAQTTTTRCVRLRGDETAHMVQGAVATGGRRNMGKGEAAELSVPQGPATPTAYREGFDHTFEILRLRVRTWSAVGARRWRPSLPLDCARSRCEVGLLARRGVPLVGVSQAKASYTIQLHLQSHSAFLERGDARHEWRGERLWRWRRPTWFGDPVRMEGPLPEPDVHAPLLTG